MSHPPISPTPAPKRHADETALARIAYAAYGATTDFKNYQGLPMPSWEMLGEKIQKAWIAAASAVGREMGVNGKDYSMSTNDGTIVKIITE